jgi:DNA-binding NarL/FixJ family response regulator
MIRVLVAEDHHLVRQGIRALLEKAEDVDVVAEASDGQQAVELVQKHVPDVLVIDVAMPRLNGLETVHRIRALGLKTRALVLSMYSDEPLVRQALKNGARGYLLKRAVSEELLLAIRAVARGEAFLSPEISSALLAEFLEPGQKSRGGSPLDQLTSREREVLQLIAEGKRTAQIASALAVSEKTAEKHRSSLMGKLNIHDTAGLVRFAIKHGLVRLDP